MKNRIALVCLAALMVVPAWAQSKSNATVTRGRYLVTQTGMCQDCHTPRDQKGNYMRDRWLMGAPIMFTPSVEMPWAGTAPPIAGLPGWTDQQALKFLTTGIDKDGNRARPPMPEYRFNSADAKAIVAYLRSLEKPAGAGKKTPGSSPAKETGE